MIVNDGLRQSYNRARRIADGDRRPYPIRVADSLTALADVIEESRDPQERNHAYSDALAFLTRRASADYLRSTGEQL